MINRLIKEFNEAIRESSAYEKAFKALKNALAKDCSDTEIYLNSMQLSDARLASLINSIASNPKSKVKKIILSQIKISVRGIAALELLYRTSTSLIEADLSKLELTDINLARLIKALSDNRQSTVQKIKIRGNTINAESIAALQEYYSKSKSLIEIDLCGFKLSDAVMAGLIQAASENLNSSVKKIDVRYNEIGNASISALEGFYRTSRSLEEVSFFSLKLSDKHLARLIKATADNRSSNVQRIYLIEQPTCGGVLYSKDNDEMLLSIEAETILALEELYRTSTTLVEVNLADMKLKDPIFARLIRALTANPRSAVATLKVRDNQIGVESIAAFEALYKTSASLIEANFAMFRLNSDVALARLIKAVISNPYGRIERIEVRYNHIGAESVSALVELYKTSVSLNEAFFSQTALSDEDLSRIIRAILVNPKSAIQQINLYATDVGKATISALEELYRTSATLKTANFDLEGGNYFLGPKPLSVIDAARLIKAVSDNPKSAVEELKIAQSAIGDETVSALEVLYRRSLSMKVVCLRYLELPDAARARLIEAIRHNSNIKKIELFGNKLGPESVSALASLFMYSPSLSEINLFGLGLDDENLSRLMMAIASNGKASIEKISIDSNTVGFKTKTVIFSALLWFNKHLVTLHRNKSDFSDQENYKIDSILGQNKQRKIEQLFYWNNIAVTGAFERANSTHAFKKSITALIPTLFRLAEVECIEKEKADQLFPKFYEGRYFKNVSKPRSNPKPKPQPKPLPIPVPVNMDIDNRKRKEPAK